MRDRGRVSWQRLFLVRRECWTLSRLTKLLLLGAALAFVLLIRWQAHPFLAVNHPVKPEVLVVEGWMPLQTLNQAAAEFQRGRYRRLLIVRSSDDQAENYFASREYNENVASLLTRYGVPGESVDTLFWPVAQRDRTYHAALAVRDWFTQNGIAVNYLNVATVGPHARRSWLMYRKAFGETTTIGIIALDDKTYDPKHWWRTSKGAREVLVESIAYVYAKLFRAWN